MNNKGSLTVGLHKIHLQSLVLFHFLYLLGRAKKKKKKKSDLLGILFFACRILNKYFMSKWYDF
jgi:hypothetical protein